jgi:hypothetical protein
MSVCGVGLRGPRGVGLLVVVVSLDVVERAFRLSRLDRRKIMMDGRRANFKVDMYMYY